MTVAKVWSTIENGLGSAGPLIRMHAGVDRRLVGLPDFKSGVGL